MKISYKESVPKREDIGVSSYLLYIVILCIILFWVWLQKPRFFLLVMGIKTIFYLSLWCYRGFDDYDSGPER